MQIGITFPGWAAAEVIFKQMMKLRIPASLTDAESPVVNVIGVGSSWVQVNVVIKTPVVANK